MTIVVDADSFHTRVKGVPAWLMTIVKMTSKKIRNADRLLQSIGGSRHGINIILALYYHFLRFGGELDPVLTRQFLVRLLNATDESIIRVLDFLVQQKLVECGELKIKLLDKLRLAEYCDFLRLFLQKTFEQAAVPAAEIRDFIMTVAGEMPETVSRDGKRPPMVELQPEMVGSLLEKANIRDGRSRILAECGELALCTIIAAETNDGAAGPPEPKTLRITTALWRQWYLYFLYNGVLPCM